MSFVEDLSIFVNADAPGAKPCVINGNSVYGLFDAAYADALGMAGSGPALTVIDDQVGNVTYGSAVTVDGVAYTVRGIEPDGHGISVLRLER